MVVYTHDRLHHTPVLIRLFLYSLLNKDLLYQIALTRIPQVGCVHAKTLTDHFPDAESIFKAPVSKLEKLEGIGEVRAKNIKSFKGFEHAEQEITFIEKYKITPLFIKDDLFPKRLLNCYDPPTLLFYKGTASLNHKRVISVIGTRSYSEYGKYLTEILIRSLEKQQVLVISGLAFGVDALAHKNCIKNNIPTIGVLAHGLDTLYPVQHTSLARDMVSAGGGLLTEFASNTKPDKHNFPTRNRIVAGMSDATVVIESGVKGGSMLTADLANDYNRDVFAFPGKISDAKSAGCNYLIKNNKAMLLSQPNDLPQLMGWTETPSTQHSRQKKLFPSLSPVEQKIVELLTEKESLAIDEINMGCGYSGTATAAALLNLELQNVVTRMPGKLYRLL